MTEMDNGYYSQKPCHTGVSWKKISAGEIIINTHDSRQIRLTPMGSDIFERCNGRQTISEISDYLRGKYNQLTADQIESETYQFLYLMQSLGVLIIDWDEF
jgi:hypothetical protein